MIPVTLLLLAALSLDERAAQFLDRTCRRVEKDPEVCRLREVERRVARYAALLEVHREIRVVVLKELPERERGLNGESKYGGWAWARRMPDQKGCLLEFMPESVVPSLEAEVTIAHEVCHCKSDWHAMTVGGERAAGMTQAQMDGIEERAWVCAQDAVKEVLK